MPDVHDAAASLHVPGSDGGFYENKQAAAPSPGVSAVALGGLSTTGTVRWAQPWARVCL